MDYDDFSLCSLAFTQHSLVQWIILSKISEDIQGVQPGTSLIYLWKTMHSKIKINSEIILYVQEGGPKIEHVSDPRECYWKLLTINFRTC